MNKHLLTSFISASFLALATTLSVSEPSYAGGTKFVCKVLGGVYRTFAYTEDGRRYKVIMHAYPIWDVPSIFIDGTPATDTITSKNKPFASLRLCVRSF